MAAWTPPSFRYYRYPDGTMTILDEKGNVVPAPPMMNDMGANGDTKVIDPWGNEVPEYVPTYPDGFFIHTFSDGSLMAVDASGVPLLIQPELGHGGPEFAVASDYAVLSDGTVYEAPVYEFPEEFFLHTAADGSMMAVDASGVPLPIQPKMGHSMDGDGPEFAVLADGTMSTPPAYEFPEEFFIHTFPDGSLMAVDASGVPLPIQPKMGHSMDGDGPEFAVLPGGTMYIPPPLYPPEGEPPEEWPPAGWETEGDSVPVDTGEESDGSDAVEAAADQGPDSASADPADPIGVDDGVDEELQGEIAAEDGDLTASIDDARSDIEPAAEGSLDYDVSGLLTAGLVETPIGGEAPGIPDAPALNDEVAREALDPAPSREIPAGVDEVSATPIILPSEEPPVGGEVVSATPIILPSEELPVGGDDVSVLPIPVPEPPAPGGVEPNVDRTVDDEIALDRKGGDAPVGVGIDEVLPTEVEFTVEAIEEVHIEEVRFEEAEVASVESVEPAFEPEVSVLDEEGVDDLEI